MPAAVLIVASTRVHKDAQEILRIQDTVSALFSEGYAVDLLVPRLSPLLSAALDPAARIFTVPNFPLCGNPPPRASIRRFLTAILMALRGIALTARNDYTVLHGVNDGSIIARAIGNLTITAMPCIAEFHSPFAENRHRHGLRTAIARALENRTFRRAAAVVLPDSDVLDCFNRKLSRARVSLIPDPHAEISPDAFTVGEFNSAIAHVYEYVLRPRFEN